MHRKWPVTNSCLITAKYQSLVADRSSLGSSDSIANEITSLSVSLLPPEINEPLPLLPGFSLFSFLAHTLGFFG